ncbi:MAG: ribosome small subunit-dependent GTPase A [Candidatus Fimenecus sp.]
MENNKGIILKGIGGFYYVEVADTIYECKARGVFRKEKITPFAGDYVKISVNDKAENTIDEIFERRNSLIRPPVANIDNLIIVVSTVQPRPNFLLIDKLIAVAEHKGIEPVIVITKTDLADDGEIINIYKQSGIKVISKSDSDYLLRIKDVMSGKINAFTGNSGVGKTTLLNSLDTTLNRSTGEISDKLGRGRHTTRQAELFKTCGGYVIDTPGFSSFEFEKNDYIKKEDLAYCFREFREYLGDCKFTSCTHTNDKGCAICEAVNNGIISKSRHNSYISMYEQAKKIKEWEL